MAVAGGHFLTDIVECTYLCPPDGGCLVDTVYTESSVFLNVNREILNNTEN